MASYALRMWGGACKAAWAKRKREERNLVITMASYALRMCEWQNLLQNIVKPVFMEWPDISMHVKYLVFLLYFQMLKYLGRDLIVLREIILIEHSLYVVLIVQCNM